MQSTQFLRLQDPDSRKPDAQCPAIELATETT